MDRYANLCDDTPGNLKVIYSFPDSASDYGRGYSKSKKFVAFNGNEIASFQTVVAQVNNYLSHLDLVQNTANADDSTADIRIAKTVTKGADAWAYYPDTGKGGDIWFNRNDAGVVDGGKGGMNWDPDHLNPGDYTYTVFMHEFGHALGLKHSFESGGVAGAVPKAFDSLEYTLMSYDAYQANPYDSTVDQRNWWADDGNNPETYMMLDIAALQHMYGADFTTSAGNTDYNVDKFPTTSAGKILMTLWDGDGIDTYDFADYSVGVSIDLQPGHWVTIDYQNTTDPYERADLLAGDGTHWAAGNIANALIYDGVNNDAAHPDAGYIENAIGGSGNDVLIGNVKDNVLTGGDGNDTLTGGQGNDIFVFNSLSGWDLISDFTIGLDKLQFDHMVFDQLTPSTPPATGNTLASGEFALWAPTDSNDYIIYDSFSGALFYDADGNDTADTPVQVAILGASSHPSLSNCDILIG